MALYNICSLLIEAETLPRSFQPFLINEDQCKEDIDLTVRQEKNQYSKENYIKAAELSQMTVWKTDISDTDHYWLFESRNGAWTALIDKDYTKAEYSYLYALDYFEKNEILEIISPFFQFLIECKLIRKNITVLHAACVEIDGTAYAFTGPSGIGKSSRAGKWCELLSAEWISGDRPAIDTDNGVVYGAPWDGKENIFRNISCPLAAIFKVVRSEITGINKMSEDKKLQLLCEQTFIPLWDEELAGTVLHSLKNLIKTVPVYELCCDITDEAVFQTYDMITKSINHTGGPDNENET